MKDTIYKGWSQCLDLILLCFKYQTDQSLQCEDELRLLSLVVVQSHLLLWGTGEMLNNRQILKMCNRKMINIR